MEKREIIEWLDSRGEKAEELFRKAREIRYSGTGSRVYLRGLIEISNVCNKDCYYCGIRKSNLRAKRYSMSVDEVAKTASRAIDMGFTSLVLQSGEMQGPGFRGRITRMLREIQKISGGQARVTLSCGEQSRETYDEWFEAGARRYLLRIETSNEKLFRQIHPQDGDHCLNARLRALKSLQDAGYQTGTGVMIGLPGQFTEDLAEDLLFMKNFSIDMAGMGPYIPHSHTPMHSSASLLWPGSERFFMTRKMVAVLRLLMPDINIAATTASEAILPRSREILIASGANVFMPNLTPGRYMGDYALYDNKPGNACNEAGTFNAFTHRLEEAGYTVAGGEAGDPLHYRKRISADSR